MSRRQYLQIPGPTNIPDRVIRAMAVPMINQRGAEYAQLQHDCLTGLKAVFGTQGDVVMYPASGSGGLECAIVNTLSPGDKIISVCQGVFSERSAITAAAYGVEVDRIDVEWGKAVDPEEIFARLRADASIKAVTVVHNETATGVLNDVRTIGLGMRAMGHSALLMVDAVSAIGSAEIRPDEWGIDVVTAGSQKGLMLPPGMAFNAIGPRAWKAYEESRLPKFYWDWLPMKKVNESGSAVLTPAVGLMFGLREALAIMQEEGLANVYARHERLARATRAAVRAMGMSVLPDESVASPTVTAVRLANGVEWAAFSQLMNDRYNVVLGGGLDQLAGKVFRIGHMGAMHEPELLAVLACMEMGLYELGAEVELGAGVRAAQESFLRESALALAER